MTHISLTLDCNSPQKMAPFWVGALAYQQTQTDGPYVVLAGAPDGIPDLFLQGVPEPRTAKNRMHLDIMVPDFEAEAVRLERLGARRLEASPRRESGVSWIVMADPEGNEFCVGDHAWLPQDQR